MIFDQDRFVSLNPDEVQQLLKRKIALMAEVVRHGYPLVYEAKETYESSLAELRSLMTDAEELLRCFEVLKAKFVAERDPLRGG